MKEKLQIIELNQSLAGTQNNFIKKDTYTKAKTCKN